MKKKTRFLWIHDLPPKCRDVDLRKILEKRGSVQKIRLFRDGSIRHAIASFADMKSAAAVFNTENKLHDTSLKVEYCDSNDISRIINTRKNNHLSTLNNNRLSAESNNNNNTNNSAFANYNHNNNNCLNNTSANTLNVESIDHKNEKEHYTKNASRKSSFDTQQQQSLSLTNNDHHHHHLGRGPLIFKRTTSTTNPINTTHSATSGAANPNHNQPPSNQVLRPMQSLAVGLRKQSTNLLRGLKLTDLPPSTKVSDTLLRQSLFTEFRRCGHIQSVVLPSSTRTNATAVSSSNRVAIVTFRRPEEAECAYEAIQNGGKMLFSTCVTAELHPGFTSHADSDVSTVRRSSTSSKSASFLHDVPTNHKDHHHHHPNSTLSPSSSMSANSNAVNENQKALNNATSSSSSKLPTRTLHVAGLTDGPTGPVTAEQLTTAFRKFGDIINVQLETSSHSALIQFAELRGPIRAMNAHVRDPLRLGGRPLSLAYTPSPPTMCLWVSDMPPALASLTGEQIMHTLSQLVPIEEIALINRSESSRLLSPPSSNPTPHYAAYIRLGSVEHAVRLLSELRLGKYFAHQNGLVVSSSRKPIAVDFASPRQSNIVSTLQMNIGRLSSSYSRIQIISASSMKSSSTSESSIPITSTSGSALNTTTPAASCANTLLTSSRSLATKTVDHHRKSSATNATSFVPNDVSVTSKNRFNAKQLQRSSNDSHRHHRTKSSKWKHLSSTDKPTMTKIEQQQPQSYGGVAKRTTERSQPIPSRMKRSTSTSSSISTASSSDDVSSISSSSSCSSSSSSSSSTSSVSSISSSSESLLSSNSNKSSKLLSTSNRLYNKSSSTAVTNQLPRKLQSSLNAKPSTLTTAKTSRSSAVKANAKQQSGPNTTTNNNLCSSRNKSTTQRLPTNATNPTLSVADNPTVCSGSFASSPSVGFLRTPPIHHNHTAANEFKVSPSSRSCSISTTSSGVSSAGPSFGSANSSGGGSAESSPLNTAAISHGQSFLTNDIASCSSAPTTIKCTSTPLHKSKRTPHLKHSSRSSSVDNTDVCQLKIRLSTSSPPLTSTLVSSLAASSLSTASCTTTTNAMHMSIKLNTNRLNVRHSPTPAVHHVECLSAKPYSTSSSTATTTAVNGIIDHALPTLPSSAPPYGYKVSVHRSVSLMESQSVSTPNGGDDWWNPESPVYESMYDKIKRRTNKEAEDRRQRQMEAANERNKKRRKQRKSDAVNTLTKSPTNSIATTDSLGSGDFHVLMKAAPPKCRHSSTTSNPNAANVGNRSRERIRPYSRSKAANEHVFASDTMRANAVGSRPATKRRRRNSFSSTLSFSSDETRQNRTVEEENDDDSNSPPGTLTRLSLGMRFPVSASYHKCIRPLKHETTTTPHQQHSMVSHLNSKWSQISDDDDDDDVGGGGGEDDDDDDLVSQFGSSCSSSCCRTALLNDEVDNSVGQHSKRDRILSKLSPTISNKNTNNIMNKLSSKLVRNPQRPLYQHAHPDHYQKFDNVTNAKVELSVKTKHSNQDNGMLYGAKSKNHKRPKLSEAIVSSNNNDLVQPLVNNSTTTMFKRSQLPTAGCLNTDVYPSKRKYTSPHLLNNATDRSPTKNAVTVKQLYFSDADDDDVLDSDDMMTKTSMISGSDSLSHTTTGGTSEHSRRHHSGRTDATTFKHRNDNDELSLSPNVLDGETDCHSSSYVFELDSRADHSPERRVKHRSKTKNHKLLLSRSKLVLDPPYHAHHGDNGTGCDPLGFDYVLDHMDRYSADSKSTASTEPMEQCDVNDLSPCLKFSDDNDDSSLDGDGEELPVSNDERADFDKSKLDDDVDDDDASPWSCARFAAISDVPASKPLLDTQKQAVAIELKTHSDSPKHSIKTEMMDNSSYHEAVSTPTSTDDAPVSTVRSTVLDTSMSTVDAKCHIKCDDDGIESNNKHLSTIAKLHSTDDSDLVEPIMKHLISTSDGVVVNGQCPINVPLKSDQSSADIFKPQVLSFTSVIPTMNSFDISKSSNASSCVVVSMINTITLPSVISSQNETPTMIYPNGIPTLFVSTSTLSVAQSTAVTAAHSSSFGSSVATKTASQTEQYPHVTLSDITLLSSCSSTASNANAIVVTAPVNVATKIQTMTKIGELSPGSTAQPIPISQVQHHVHFNRYPHVRCVSTASTTTSSSGTVTVTNTFSTATPNPSVNCTTTSTHATSGNNSSITTLSTSQLTEAHDITRYVQSVIERVKAERVEENQQAAAAAAHHYHNHHHHASTTLVSSQSLKSCPAGSVNSASLGPSIDHCVGLAKRSSHSTTSSSNVVGSAVINSNQRRSLLLTTSTCSNLNSSSKMNLTTKCSKVLASQVVHTYSTAVAMASTTVPVCSSLSVPLTSTTTTSFEINNPVFTMVSTLNNIIQSTLPILYNTNAMAVQSSSSSSDHQLLQHMPSIPGVNACTPLVSAISNVNCNPVVINNGVSFNHPTPPTTAASSLLVQTKRIDHQCDLTTGAFATPSSPTGCLTRRQKRNEVAKIGASVVLTVPTTNASGPHMATTATTCKTSLLQSTHLSSTPSASSSLTSILGHKLLSDELSIVATQSSGKEFTTNTTAEKMLATSRAAAIDPYEPNFDEDSPKTFDTSQLHHHLHNHHSSIGVQKIATITTTTTSPTSTESVLLTSTAAAVAATKHEVSNNNFAECAPSTGAAIASSTRPMDSVDEVIRDVCAGQFDVKSYLNGWRSTNQLASSKVQQPGGVGGGSTTSSTSVTTSSNTISTSKVMSHHQQQNSVQPAKTVSVGIVNGGVANPTTAIPFALPISSEPLVAAVTIPVSAASNVSSKLVGNLGKNGANTNVVNIGTGNALLNTLLAALQLIPGSQVTVTGPAAAASMVGNLGVTNPGTISATTITLPVNAARQAAANIKAAVQAQLHTSANANNIAVNSSTNVSANTTTTATIATDSMAVSISGSTASHMSVVISKPTVNSMSQPSQASSNQSTSSQAATGIRSNEPPSAVGTFINPSLSNNPLVSINSNLIVPSTASAVLQHSSMMKQVFLSTNRSSPMHVSATTDPTPFTSSTHSIASSIKSFGSTSAAFLTTSSPMTSSLVDRLTDNANNMDPAVAALLHAALGNGTIHRQQQMRRGLLGDNTATESQLSPYLRQIVQQIIDNRTADHVTTTTSLAASGVGDAMVSKALDSNFKNIANSGRTTGLLNTETISTVSSGSGELKSGNVAISSSPVISTNSGLASANRSFASPLSVNINDLTSGAGNDGSSKNMANNAALISPPVGVPRSVVNLSEVHLAKSQSNISNPWSSIGTTYPLVWQGRLSLKNIETRVALHYIQGNHNLLNACMTLLASGGGGQSLVSSGGPLRIVQRMRLEPAQLEGVQRKINQEGASCVCLALPTGNSTMELVQQTHILNDNFIRYMQEKMAAGIINVGHPDYQQGLYVVHIFPPCEFSYAQMNVAAPDLHRLVVQANQSHLLVVITTV